MATLATSILPNLISARGQRLLRVERLFPGDPLAGVGGHAAHDGGQVALGGGLQLVVGLALADRGDEVDVLLDVRVDVLGALVAPGRVLAPGAQRPLGVGQVDPALGADHVLADVVVAAGDLAGHRQHLHAARVLEVDREVVVDVAEGRIDPLLAAAHAHRRHRRLADGPLEHVDVVDVLLDDVVARQPGEVQPVADLPLGVGPGRLPGLEPQVPLQPEARARPPPRRSRRRGCASSPPGSPCCGGAAAPRRCASFFLLASSATSKQVRMPGPSTAIGFSVKTCLPAATAARRWVGRKPGGEARTT